MSTYFIHSKNAMNVLNAMPKSIQAKAKGHLRDIWLAETKAKANVAFNFFVKTYGVKWARRSPSWSRTWTRC